MTKQYSITAFALSTLENELSQEKNIIIASTVIINNFEIKLNIQKIILKKINLNNFSNRKIIINNYEKEDDMNLKNRFFF